MNEQIDNDLKLSLSQALDLIKTREGDNCSNAKVNLAELQRLTNISRPVLSVNAQPKWINTSAESLSTSKSFIYAKSHSTILIKDDDGNRSILELPLRAKVRTDILF